MSGPQKKLSAVLVLLLLLAFPARYLILTRAHRVALNDDSIAYQIEKGLQTSGSSYRPLEGKDYTQSAKKSFDNGNWVAVTIAPLSNSLNTESLVLKKVGGSYEVVYGPSNFFQGNDFDSLPADIKNYLTNKS